MKKRFFALMLTVFAAAVLLTVTVCAADVSDLKYKITDGEVTITDCSSKASGDLTIPSAIEGYPVTRIGNYAFYYCRSLTSVSIPDSVTRIGDSAFYCCYDLKSVTIPDGVTSIGDYAFYCCTGLSSVKIGSSVTSIGECAFDGCSSLTSVTIPDSVTSIGREAFSGCTGLSSVKIGSSVTSIDVYAFLNCSSLTSVTIPDSVTDVGGGLFSGCTSLQSVKLSNQMTELLSQAEETGDGEDAVDYYIGFFDGCSSLERVIIPDSITSIGERAFHGCSSLTSVMIPDSVTSIGWSAFSGCSSLTSVAIPNSITDVGSVFYDCTGLTSVTIPDSVTSIGGYAFYGCTGLTSVTIPDSVTHIGERAFYSCSSLASVTFPDSVTSIGYEAFYKCTSLTSVMIPDGVTSIGSCAFSGCTGLTSVTIGSGVTSIHNTAFSGCSSLSQVNVDSRNSVYSSKNGVLYNNEKSKLICYPTGKADASFTIPDSVTSIGDDAFEDCTSLTSVTIPNSVTSIGYCAFEGCSSLTSVTIPDSVASIGFCAFEGCSSLTSVTIPDSVTSIGSRAFEGCTGLTNVTIGSGVTSIEWATFEDCTGLTSVTIPDSVTSISYGAFEDCSRLTDVYYTGSVDQWKAIDIRSDNDPLKTATIHYHFNPAEYLNFSISDGEATVTACNPAISGALEIPAVYQGYPVTAIAEEAFAECDQMTSVTIPSCMKTIGKQAFLHCTGLTRVDITDLAAWCGMTFVDNPLDNAQNLYLNGKLLTDLVIPDGVQSIPTNAFYRCTCLERVTIPESVQTIGSHAFFRCSGLTEVKMAEGVTKIGKRAFCYCASLETVTIPKSVTTITSGAFEGCSALTDVYYNGTEAAWSSIAIDTKNEPLTGAAIHYALAITAQPKATTIAGGSTATFKVAASGNGLKYQWQFQKPDGSWTNCTSKTTGYHKATLKVEGVTGSTNRNGYQYRCKVTDAAGNAVTSSAAKLTVKVLKITTQPKDATIAGGGTATFKVAATGDGLKYQWQFQKPSGSWTNCTSKTEGYNTATLKVQGVTDSTNRNGYQYRCKVTDSAGNTVTSDAATLTVKVLKISTQPKAASVKTTAYATFTVKATGDGLKYQWQYKKPSGSWTNCSSKTTGYNKATLKVQGVTGSTNRNGYQYRCIITDSSGAKVTSSAVKLNVLAITTQPKAASVAKTGTATFKVAATGSSLKYQWQYLKPNGSWTNCTSATQGYNTATLKVQGASGSTNRNGYQYRCVITDAAGNKLTTSAVKLTVK